MTPAERARIAFAAQTDEWLRTRAARTSAAGERAPASVRSGVAGAGADVGMGDRSPRPHHVGRYDGGGQVSALGDDDGTNAEATAMKILGYRVCAIAADERAVGPSETSGFCDIRRSADGGWEPAGFDDASDVGPIPRKDAIALLCVARAWAKRYRVPWAFKLFRIVAPHPMSSDAFFDLRSALNVARSNVARLGPFEFAVGEIGKAAGMPWPDRGDVTKTMAAVADLRRKATEAPAPPLPREGEPGTNRGAT